MISAMKRAAFLAAALSVWPAGRADANGRFPQTTNVRFKPGALDTILLPSSFGLLISKDGGTSFKWICEDAIGYSGVYDPDYAYSADGNAIYATTFEGLRVSTDDGCSWEGVGAPLTNDKFINQVEVGPDGRIWATTSTGGMANDVYVADGVDQPFVGTGDLLTADNGWWLSIATTADSDQVIYVSGYLPQGAETPPVGRLRRSTDGGATWDDLDAVLDVDTGDIVWGDADPLFYLLGASPADASVLFARAVAVNPPLGDAIYRSSDGGDSWVKVLDFADSVSAFTIRADGMGVIAATQNRCPDDPEDASKGCVYVSSNAGVDWSQPTEQPMMNCVGERSDGALYACGANFEPDNFAFGSSDDDGDTWETVWRFSAFEAMPDGNGPLDCPDGTIQNDTCENGEAWQTLACNTFMFDFDMCAAPEPDAGPDIEPPDDGGDGGCCRVSDGPPKGSLGAAMLIALWLLVWGRRKR